MRYQVSMVVLAVLLTGCAGSAASPTPTPATNGNTITRVGTIPMTTPPPTLTGRHRATVVTGKQTSHLPTVRPIRQAPPTPFPASMYTAVLMGTITDSKTHAPLAGAIVSVGYGNHRTRTDAFGKYRISYPAGPAVPVAVSMNGYAGSLQMGRILPHQTYTLNFALPSIVPGHPVAPPPPGFFGTH